MPRISLALVRRALKISPLLPPLLRADPNIELARRELKWIQNELPQEEWRNAIWRRSRLEPLQYILKSQPFGPIDIKCRKGVLIPRWETEEWCSRLSATLETTYHDQDLNIIDACTGSGCIPLLMSHQLLETVKVSITGFDVSEEAYSLAQENKKSYTETFKPPAITFKQADLFDKNIHKTLGVDVVDLITSNPPYIPQADYESSLFLNGVEKSVRIYEPSLALIGENEFYEELIQNLVIPSQASGFVFELGSEEQALCVRNLLQNSTAQIWQIGTMKDTNGKLRCVIGWQEKSPMSTLSELCDDIYETL